MGLSGSIRGHTQSREQHQASEHVPGHFGVTPDQEKNKAAEEKQRVGGGFRRGGIVYGRMVMTLAPPFTFANPVNENVPFGPISARATAPEGSSVNSGLEAVES